LNKGQKEVQIFQDTDLLNGIGVAGLTTLAPQNQDTITPFGTGTGKPLWRIAQWGSNFYLTEVQPQHKGDTVIYSNQGKKLGFLKEKDATSVFLYVYGSREYSEPRKNNEAWPHLLIEQNLEMPIKISQLSNIQYQISAKLLFVDMKMTEQQFDPNLHTCQVTLFLTVQNHNRESEFYGDYFWFGLPLYDVRNRYIAEYAAQDAGKDDATKKFILSVAGSKLFEGSMHDKQWISISKDIYPLIVDAFRQTQEKGYMKESRFEDLAIGSMNVGWEVPGTFDCGIQLKGFSMIGIYK
jgi:hypothetical protein